MKKKIVLYIPSIEGGGVEKNFFMITNYLSRKYKKIFIVTADRKFKKNLGNNVILITPRSNKWSKKSRIIKTLISIFLLLKYFKSEKLILISFQSNISSILVSKIFNYKIIIRLNTSLKKYINNSLKRYFYKFFYNLADEIIVNSKYFKNEVEKFLNLKSILIYNSNQNSKKKKILRYFKNFNGLKILNIGRLTDQKDHITLVKSLRLLSKKKISFRCCIIGSGANKIFLKNYINSEKLNTSIKLLGFKKEAEIYLPSSDLFVLTSKFEGSPNVLIEAQSRNIPIISSDCPTGPKEILLNGKLGDLFKVGDHKKLFSLIQNFKKNKKKLISKSRKAKKYLKRFDLNSNCEKYSKVISNYLQ